MELRVTVRQRARSTVVQVDGRLTASHLHELEQLVAAVVGPAVIDLSNLLSADDAGVATLRSLAGRGVSLVGATPYVSLLLADERAPTRPRKGRSLRPRKR